MRSLLDRRAHISFHIQQMSFEAFFEGTGDNGSGKSARDGSPHRRCHFGEAAGLHGRQSSCGLLLYPAAPEL
jgi:hypothetical protein